jgi:hypothetical protein
LSNRLSLAGDLSLASRFKSLDSQVDIFMLGDHFVIRTNFSVEVHLVLFVAQHFHISASAALLILISLLGTFNNLFIAAVFPNNFTFMK